MQRKRVSGALEQKLITGLITSKPFLAAAAPLVDTGLLRAAHTKRIADWCLEYYAKYRKAPGKHIEALYHAWVETEGPPEETADAVGDFLGQLSGAYDAAPQINVPYLVDETAKYLTLRKIGLLNDNLTMHLMRGDREGALSTIADFKTVDPNSATGYAPLQGKRAIRMAFSEPQTSIFTMPGAAGRFFGNAFCRDGLIGIQGPEKRGKTFWCMEFMYWALRARLKVAVFQCGDLSERQFNRRLAVRLAESPLEAPEGKWPATVLVPKAIKLITKKDAKGQPCQDAKVRYKSVKFRSPLDEAKAQRARREFGHAFHLPPTFPNPMFSVHPNTTVNVAGIEAILERWRDENGFTPDVIVIDYADILAPENPREERRHWGDTTWRALRRLSQTWHACVITPTQANAAAYKARTQSMANFSEEKRKFAHVTGMLGLNQTPAEKDAGVMRLNWIVLREAPFSLTRCLWVAQCLPLGRALVKSVW